MVEPDWPQIAIRRKRNACWMILGHRHTLRISNTLIFQGNSCCTNAPQYYGYTYIANLFHSRCSYRPALRRNQPPVVQSVKEIQSLVPKRLRCELTTITIYCRDRSVVRPLSYMLHVQHRDNFTVTYQIYLYDSNSVSEIGLGINMIKTEQRTGQS